LWVYSWQREVVVVVVLVVVVDGISDFLNVGLLVFSPRRGSV